MERLQATREQIQIARKLYQTDDIEIDDDALQSPVPESGGYWVSAWVWVNAEEKGN